jgi:hypothetical protein
VEAKFGWGKELLADAMVRDAPWKDKKFSWA